MLKLGRNQTGETIIEVLIALTILSLVLGFSFASGRNSLSKSQDAQERTVASQLAQSTIEVIKTYATSATSGSPMEPILFPAGDSNICVSTDIADVSANNPPVAYPNAAVCDHGMYKTRIAIHPLGGTTGAFEYTVYVEWEGLVTGTTSQVVMRYKWVRITT